MTELLKVFILQQHHIRIDALRPPQTKRFFVIELQTFLSDSNRDKISRDIRLPNLVSTVDIISRLTAFRVGAELIMLEKTLLRMPSDSHGNSSLVEERASPDKLSWPTAH